MNLLATRSLVAAVFVLAAGQALAFRSTSSQSFTDPDYKDFRAKKIVLIVNDAPNEMRAEIEERMTTALMKQGTEVVAVRSLFPPTREWTAEEQTAVFQREQVDSAMIVTVGATSKAVIPIMTQSHSNTTVSGTVYGSGYYHGTGSTNTTSHPVYGAKSKAEFSAVLMDVVRNRTIWYADITVKAAGTLFVSDTGDAKGVVSEIVEALGKDGHLETK